MFVNIFKNYYQKKYNLDESKIVRVNVSTFNQELIESELFGHAKGAFTGAIKERLGFIKKADGGLLIIEEIGELTHPIQAKLLTFIEDGYFYQVGSEEISKSNVQIIATTNKHQEEKAFRLDLWSRFFQFYIPPLYERRIDVLYHLYTINKDILLTITEEELLSILAYNWPGNVREIENISFLLKWKDSYRNNYNKKSMNLKIKDLLATYDITGEGEKVVWIPTYLDSTTLGELYSTSSILWKNTKYSALNFNFHSRFFVFDLKNYGIDSSVVEDFFRENKFSLTEHNLAFKKNLEIPIEVDNNIGLKYIGESDVFNEYEKRLITVCEPFSNSINLPKDLFDIKEGELSVQEKISHAWIKHINEIANSTCYDKKLRSLFELQGKILQYRLGTKMKDRTELDIVSMTEKGLLTEYYKKLLEKTNGNKKEAGKIAGINKQIYQRMKKYNL